MIDWLTFELPFRHEPIDSDIIVRVDSNGVSKWVTKCSTPVVGSFDGNIYCSSVGSDSPGMASHLRISGNPAKWLQGHNILGTDDIILLISTLLRKLFPILGFDFSPFVESSIPQSKLYRIDITYNYSLPCRADVINWLRAAEFKSRSRSGRPVSKGSTLYFQKNSRRWSIKFYSKGQEISVKGHEISDKVGLEQKSLLTEYSQNLLRSELTLRRMELVHIGCDTVGLFCCFNSCSDIYGLYMNRIQLSGQNSFLSEVIFQTLKPSIRSTYILWREGHNPLSVMSKATFYRHRKVLLDYEIDISIPPQGGADSSGYIPILQPLSAKPASIPSWVDDFNLIVA